MRKRVLVLGAGFTKAFYPDAPLMEAPYDAAKLRDRLHSLPEAKLILDLECRRHKDGWINVERLMTRLESGMPYDRNRKADGELALFLSWLKEVFMGAIRQAKRGANHKQDLLGFSKYCLYHC